MSDAKPGYFVREVSRQRAELAADETTTSTTYVNSALLLVTDSRIGTWSASCCFNTLQNTAAAFCLFRYRIDLSEKSEVGVRLSATTDFETCCLFFTGALGEAISMEWRVTAGTGTNRGSAELFSHLEVLEIS